MIGKLKWNKVLWLLVALMALTVSVIGVVYPGVYRVLVNAENLPAAFAQDLITILASLAMLFLIVTIKDGDYVKQLILLGIVGYLFYGYGIFVLGKVYNVLYFLYLEIFSLSFFSLVYGIVTIGKKTYDNIDLPAIVRKVSAGFLFLIPVIFYPLWIITMVPFIRELRVPGIGSNVYILDICFVLPVFTVMAVMLLKKNDFAILLTPVLLIKGFTLCLSVALSEFLKLFYNQTMNIMNAILFLFLTLACLVLTVIYFKKVRYAKAG